MEWSDTLHISDNRVESENFSIRSEIKSTLKNSQNCKHSRGTAIFSTTDRPLDDKVKVKLSHWGDNDPFVKHISIFYKLNKILAMTWFYNISTFPLMRFINIMYKIFQITNPTIQITILQKKINIAVHMHECSQVCKEIGWVSSPHRVLWCQITWLNNKGKICMNISEFQT